MVSPGAEGRGTLVRKLLEPLRGLLDRAEVTELSINRPGEVWATTHAGREQHHMAALSDNHLESLARALVVFNDMAEAPIASVLLPDGERGQIVLPPACLKGTLSLSIRKHASTAYTLDELEAQGAFEAVRDVSFNQPSEEKVAELLESRDFKRLDPIEAELLALKRQGRYREFLERAVVGDRNIVVAGKTMSGKTTLTRSLIERVPSRERVITIEDVHELHLPNHPNKVHMMYGAGAGEVSAEEALRSCMRQSPDRIFLAELRGNEAWEYINSLNTGHPGSITTTHANSAVMTFSRIASLIKNSPSGKSLDMDAITATLEQTVHVVLFIHKRKLVEVYYDPIYAKSKLG